MYEHQSDGVAQSVDSDSGLIPVTDLFGKSLGDETRCDAPLW